MLVEGELQGAETDAFGQFILGLGQVALDLDALQTVRQSPLRNSLNLRSFPDRPIASFIRIKNLTST